MPPARTGELLRLGRMGMTPGGGMVVMAVIAVCVTMIVVMIVLMPVMIVAVSGMGMIVLIVCVMIVMMRRRDGGADRGRTVHGLQRVDERATLHPQQPRADQDDQ